MEGSDTSGTKGLGSHLGFVGSNKERNSRLWPLAGKDKGGMYPEVAAERLFSDYAAEMGIGLDGDASVTSIDMFNEILDILQSVAGCRFKSSR